MLEISILMVYLNCNKMEHPKMQKMRQVMNRLTKIFLLVIFSFATIGVMQPFAAEWYESMESSGIDQSHSVLKNIVTSGSVSERSDVKQAITEIAESVSREAEQNAESSPSREQDASHPSEQKSSTQSAEPELGLMTSPVCP